MEQIIVEAKPREDRGKNAARRMRVAGFVPAVLYGGKEDAVALAADTTAAPQVRALADYKIASLAALARRRARLGTEASRAHWSAIAADFTRWTATWVQPPGAAPRSTTRAPGFRKWNLSSSWMSLKAERER